MSGATLPLVLLAALAIFTGGVVLDHRRERRRLLSNESAEHPPAVR
jgi:hypothetical protein